MTRYSRAESLDRPYSPRHNPLPYKNGVNATRLRIPDVLADGSVGTIGDYLQERFPHITRQDFQERFDRKEIVGIAGTAVFGDTPLTEHDFIWYYRTLPQEKTIPFEISIVDQDEDLIVIDKPHFLPTTPGGKYIQETALVRLRVLLGEDHIVPIHRLDKLTAGLLLFSRNPKTRGSYQSLFEKRQVKKSYEAIADYITEYETPQNVQSYITKTRGILTADETVDKPPNASSRIYLKHQLTRDPQKALYGLEPYTGKTHQLRLHMARLGVGIDNDPFYPVLQENADDNFENPLKLLAKTIEFTDPLNGQKRFFESSLTLED